MQFTASGSREQGIQLGTVSGGPGGALPRQQLVCPTEWSPEAGLGEGQGEQREALARRQAFSRVAEAGGILARELTPRTAHVLRDSSESSRF